MFQGKQYGHFQKYILAFESNILLTYNYYMYSLKPDGPGQLPYAKIKCEF